MTDKWYDKTPKQAADALGVDPKTGLPQKTALSRLKRHGSNVIYPIPKGAFRTYLGHVMTDFTSILLLITSAIYAALENSAQAMVMIAVLLLNYAASIITYVRAQRVLEGMGHFALPVAKVMRDGRLYLTGQDQLVAGDVILLSAGDIVPCDARLLECDGLCALETNLTGVPHTVAKDAEFLDYHDIPPSAQKNMVFASTILTAGSAKAVATAVSGDTLVCKMGKNAPIVSHDRLSVLSTLKKYCSVWSLCMIVLVFAMTALDVVIGHASRGLFEIFLSGLSLAVSSMSELYMAFGYIIIACGVWNAVKQFKDINSGALIKNSESLEKLKDVSCLIIPKEGVITLKQLRIQTIWCSGEEYSESDPLFGRKCSQILKFAVISTALYGKTKLAKNNMSGENIYTSEEDAIIDMADRNSVYNVELDRDFPVLDHEGITEDSLFETTLSGNFEPHNKGNGIDGITDDQHYAHDGRMFLVSLRGDALKLLERCDTYTRDGRLIPLTDDMRASIRIAAELKIKEAYRVIGVATKDTVYNNLTRIGACQSGLNFEGFLAVKEPLLAGAAKNVSKLEAARIKLIMLCDDVSENNLYLAQSAGVAHNPTDVLTSDAMRAMKDGLLRANVGIYRVYEGLDIAQKRQLVQYLRDSGETVGYLGKELDEISLLSAADVGFTQSVTISDKSGNGGIDLSDRSRSAPVYVKTSRDSAKSGCEALKFVADVIISEGDESGGGGFNALVGSLGAAKVVYRNLMRMVRYLLTSQFARFFVVLYSVIAHQTLFTPVQILVSGLIIDFTAVLIIAFEPPSHDILTRGEDTEKQLSAPLSHLTGSLLFGLFWAASCVGAPLISGLLGFPIEGDALIGCVFVGFALAQALVLSEIKKDASIFIPSVKFNAIYTVSLLSLLFFIALGLILPDVGALFGIQLDGLRGWICAAAPSAVMLALYELWKLISERLRK